MLSVPEILHALDHANDGYYCNFIPLNHPYSYPIDARLNLFRSDEEWAVAAEILGYNHRGGRVELLIFYYGNCLRNLEQYNNRNTNYYSVFLIAEASYQAAMSDELLHPDARTLLVRDTPVPLAHERTAYEQAGIELVEVETGRRYELNQDMGSLSDMRLEALTATIRDQEERTRQIIQHE